MKAYVITTGIVFALIVVAHIMRMITEGNGSDPFFIAITVAAAAFALWAFREVRVASRKT